METRLGGAPLVLARPMSYMNESGGPVNAAARFFKVPVERIIAVHDDLDLPFGALRVKRGGGEGGHNGLRSMTSALGSREYARVRVGIGRPPGRQDPADFVLREFGSAERKELGYLVDRAADAAEAVVAVGLEAAQNEFNEFTE
jgi:PTH1 family peptidyl-tRNA hydrolase